MILGSGFSPAFAQAIFLIDAVVILVVLLALYSGQIAAVCSAAVHRAAAMAADLIAHIGLRHR